MSPTTRPPAKVIDTTLSGLEVALGILKTLGELTKNVPYLGTVTGVISSLIALRKEMQDHKERAETLLQKIGTVAQTVAEELQRLQREPNGDDHLAWLELQLKDYADTLLNAQHILTEWTTYSTAKRMFKEKFSRKSNFDSMATFLEAKLDTYKDKFTVSASLQVDLLLAEPKKIAQLSSLGQGLHQLDQKMTELVDNSTKNRLEEWLKPARGGQYDTALHAAAVYRGSLDIVQALIAAGADVNLQGGKYSTALQAAAFAGALDIVQALIAARADVNLQGGKYGTALQAAAFAGSLDIVQALISARADVNLQGGWYSTALQAAAWAGSLDIVEALIAARADVNLQGGRS
ncbi:hypothetical protein MKEN_01462100 [Mycena kentingensis (nom. inval.)]|nr:hypothetical protein MKEN_01462100 [Mycena kentingensis (nom. inval.)]